MRVRGERNGNQGLGDGDDGGLGAWLRALLMLPRGWAPRVVASLRALLALARGWVPVWLAFHGQTRVSSRGLGPRWHSSSSSPFPAITARVLPVSHISISRVLLRSRQESRQICVWVEIRVQRF